MSIRKQNLWRVPVICILGSLAGYGLTVCFGGYFFTASTITPDGRVVLSADPVRSALWNIVLFFAVLIPCGRKFLRDLTRKEIAVSAGLISVLYFAIVLAQLYFPGFPLSLSVSFAPFQNWTGIFASMLQNLTGNFTFSVIAGTLAPFLFIPFGRKE